MDTAPITDNQMTIFFIWGAPPTHINLEQLVRSKLGLDDDTWLQVRSVIGLQNLPGDHLQHLFEHVEAACLQHQNPTHGLQDVYVVCDLTEADFEKLFGELGARFGTTIHQLDIETFFS